MAAMHWVNRISLDPFTETRIPRALLRAWAPFAIHTDIATAPCPTGSASEPSEHVGQHGKSPFVMVADQANGVHCVGAVAVDVPVAMNWIGSGKIQGSVGPHGGLVHNAFQSP